jgi:hypothetical protein
MSWQSYLTSQIQLILWTEGTKYYSQACHLVRPHQSFHLYTNTSIEHLRNNSTTFTKRLNFLWFLNLVFYIVFYFYFYYSYIINSTITILLSFFWPSLLSLLLLGYNLLFSLSTMLYASSHPLLPMASPPPPSSHNLSPHYHSLLHTHHLLTSLLYQLYTTPASCNHWHKHPALQQQKYIQTHTRATKPSIPHISSPIHPPLFPLYLFRQPLTIPQNL